LSARVTSEQDEIQRLRARVAELETEVVEAQAWANRVVAAAQERTYWLDRWHLDVNEVMRRRSAERLRMVARGVRSVVRAGRRSKHNLMRRLRHQYLP
jgi:hypothetical protein